VRYTIIVLFCFSFAYGQQDSGAEHYFTLRHDNDFLNISGHGTDRYYTGGLFLEYSFLNRKNRGFYTIGLAQLMYTPENLTAEYPVQGDYPFCGILEGYITREISKGENQLFQSSLSLGIMGPHAFAKQSQEIIHRIVHYVHPEGWGNQIPDFPIISYSMYYERSLIPTASHFGLNVYASGQAGTLENDARAGFTLVANSELHNPFPARLYNSSAKRYSKPHLYLELAPGARFVAENSILQGGFFGDKNYYHIQAKDIERLVLEGSLLLGVHFRRITLQYRQLYHTREFDSVQSHVYGSISITWKL
jgi:hypothetical protein